MNKGLWAGLVFVLLIGLVAATNYSIDVSVESNEVYAIGSDLSLNVRLVDGDGNLIQDKVDVVLSDALVKKQINLTVNSNENANVLIKDDFQSGLWDIEASYGDVVGRSFFNVAENSNVEFLIEGDRLIIRNTGNVPYTKTVLITIGGTANPYAQNLGVGSEKELVLLAPEGSYDIEITDGEKTLSRNNIQLLGTGNVIGASDPGLVGYVGLGSAGDPEKIEDGFFSSSRLWSTIIFVFAVLGISALLFARKKARGK